MSLCQIHSWKDGVGTGDWIEEPVKGIIEILRFMVLDTGINDVLGDDCVSFNYQEVVQFEFLWYFAQILFAGHDILTWA